MLYSRDWHYTVNQLYFNFLERHYSFTTAHRENWEWQKLFFFNKFIYLFIYFWLHWVFVAAHRLSLVVASGGYSFIAVRRLLVVVASLFEEHGL